MKNDIKIRVCQTLLKDKQIIASMANHQNITGYWRVRLWCGMLSVKSVSSINSSKKDIYIKRTLNKKGIESVLFSYIKNLEYHV